MHTLNELYKLYVRPHLDYGDDIYHIPAKVSDLSSNVTLPSLMEKQGLLREHGEDHREKSCTQN